MSGYNTDKKIVWGVHEDYKSLYDTLWNRIPAQGEVKGAKNIALEKYRKSSAVIYDLFNNGLCNRARELRVLGLTCDDLSFDSYIGDTYITANWDYNNEIIWEAFKPILLNAVKEQLEGLAI